jgi:beta-lactamase regulating signal transducer with metallopeptidase domain
MIATLNLNALARMSAESMLNCMLEGIAIGLFAWILLKVVGRRNSSTRFAVWFFALLAIAALPILSVAASSARAGSAGSAITVPGSWALVIFLVWALVAGVALLRVGIGLWQLRKLRRSCSVIDNATLHPVLSASLQAFQPIRRVTLCQSDRLRVPTAIGFLKPIVVIPIWAMRELSTTELNSILIHELAHLRRWDDWTNLAQQVLKALLFFHPAVWWIENKLALEREMACDDAVLAEIANPRGYAKCLISVAEKSFMRRGVALAQAAVNRVRQTSLRVSQILDVNRSSATHVWKPALYSVAAFFIACLVSLSQAPELVAFKDQAPDTMASATAGATLTSATELNSFAKPPVVTPASFRVRSDGSRSDESRSDEARLGEAKSDEARPDALTNQPAREGTASAVPPVKKLGFGWRSASSAAVNAGESVKALAAEAAKSSSSAVPQPAGNEAGLQPLRPRSPAESSFAAAKRENDRQPNTQRTLEARFVPASSTLDGNEAVAPQAIFVIMQTARYDESGPTVWSICVWRVTVVDSTRTRIPAKKI